MRSRLISRITSAIDTNAVATGAVTCSEACPTIEPRARGSNGFHFEYFGAGSLVVVLGGARYGFNEPNAITYVGSRVWVANNGTNSMTEIAAG